MSTIDIQSRSLKSIWYKINIINKESQCSIYTLVYGGRRDHAKYAQTWAAFTSEILQVAEATSIRGSDRLAGRLAIMDLVQRKIFFMRGDLNYYLTNSPKHVPLRKYWQLFKFLKMTGAYFIYCADYDYDSYVLILQ